MVTISIGKSLGHKLQALHRITRLTPLLSRQQGFKKKIPYIYYFSVSVRQDSRNNLAEPSSSGSLIGCNQDVDWGCSLPWEGSTSKFTPMAVGRNLQVFELRASVPC